MLFLFFYYHLHYLPFGARKKKLTDSIPEGSALGKAMITSSAVAGLYAAVFLLWVRQNREVRLMENNVREGLRDGGHEAVVQSMQH